MLLQKIKTVNGQFSWVLAADCYRARCRKPSDFRVCNSDNIWCVYFCRIFGRKCSVIIKWEKIYSNVEVCLSIFFQANFKQTGNRKLSATGIDDFAFLRKKFIHWIKRGFPCRSICITLSLYFFGVRIIFWSKNRSLLVKLGFCDSDTVSYCMPKIDFVLTYWFRKIFVLQSCREMGKDFWRIDVIST